MFRIATEEHYSPVDQECVAAGDILGQYWTNPTDHPPDPDHPEYVGVCGGLSSGPPLYRYGGKPSRTTVDYDGSVWVANRLDIEDGTKTYGHVVKIGTGLAYQWVDRDHDGVLDTSRCDGEICDPLDWPNQEPYDECSDADLTGAEDELILRYRVVGIPDGGIDREDRVFTRAAAVDRENNVWVGGNVQAWHVKLDGQTATTIPGTGAYFPCGGYAAVMDCNGVLWSSRAMFDFHSLLRYDPAEPWDEPAGNPRCVPVNDSYGLAVDVGGDIWGSRFLPSRLVKINPFTDAKEETEQSGNQLRGVAVTPEDNDVWVASSNTHEVKRFWNDPSQPLKDLTLKETISLGWPDGNFPTGVSVDSRGKVWVTNEFSDNVMRIDPTAGANGLGAVDLTVSLGVGAKPHTPEKRWRKGVRIIY